MQPEPQRELDDRLSLSRLDGIFVEVDEIPSLAARQKLSAERLQEDVENQLRRAKVEVLPMGHFRTGDPHIRIAIHVSDVRNRLVASHVEVNFVQIVFMRRDPTVTFNRGQTWNAKSAVVLGPEDQLAVTIRREVTRQIDQFIADYHPVNQP